MPNRSNRSWTPPSSPEPPCRAMKQASYWRQGTSAKSVSAGSIQVGSWPADSKAVTTCQPLMMLICRSVESPPASTATRNERKSSIGYMAILPDGKGSANSRFVSSGGATGARPGPAFPVRPRGVMPTRSFTKFRFPFRVRRPVARRRGRGPTRSSGARRPKWHRRRSTMKFAWRSLTSAPPTRVPFSPA